MIIWFHKSCNFSPHILAHLQQIYYIPSYFQQFSLSGVGTRGLLYRNDDEMYGAGAYKVREVLAGQVNTAAVRLLCCVLHGGNKDHWLREENLHHHTQTGSYTGLLHVFLSYTRLLCYNRLLHVFLLGSYTGLLHVFLQGYCMCKRLLHVFHRHEGEIYGSYFTSKLFFIVPDPRSFMSWIKLSVIETWTGICPLPPNYRHAM